jgi:hypothetical protein
MFLSNAAFQHNAPWSNFGMEHYGRLPRIALQNDVADTNYGNLTRPWYYSYRTLAALADGLRSLEDPDIADELGAENVATLTAYSKLVQGLAHGTIALLYDRGFVVDETTDLTVAQEPVAYGDVMEAAYGYLDQAVSLGSGGSFTVPAGWMAAEVSAQNLARLAKSWKATFRAQVGRTKAERDAADWNAIIADVDAGIQETFMMNMDWDNGWYAAILDYGTYPNWNQLAYWMYGMADQSGNYQDWLAIPLGDKSYQFTDGSPVLIVTPDTRFPQGATVEEQRVEEGAYYRITSPGQQGDTWKKPERGVWRWSWYKNSYGGWLSYGWDAVFDQPFIQLASMRLLKAEGLYRKSDLAGAAAIINETRTLYGLNATDAAGTNTSCVPKLPNGQCGNLWEMLKWEKRHESTWTGVAGANWWFDGRGWGDLWFESPLQIPVPCKELQVLQMLPCNNFGGPGGESGAPKSSYGFPFEG